MKKSSVGGKLENSKRAHRERTTENQGGFAFLTVWLKSGWRALSVLLERFDLL